MIRVVVITALAIISCTSSSTTETASTEATGVIDKMKLKTLDGAELKLDQYKGKTLFINFWATWCRPCIKEMPSIEKVKETLKDENIQFLLVSNETRGQIKSFVRSHRYKFDYAQLDMPLAELNIQGLPTTMIVNPEREIVFTEMGARDWSNEESIQLIRDATLK